MRIGVLAEKIEVRPGQPVTFTIDVANTSEIIDGYTVTLVGIPVATVTVTPPVLSLFPAADGTISVTFTLPLRFPAGPHLLGVRVASAIDQAVVSMHSLELLVLPVQGASLSLAPERVTAGRQASYTAVVENLGNVPLDVELVAADAERALRFTFVPALLALPVGGLGTVQLRAVGRRPWIGAPAPRVFTVTTVAPAPPVQATGTFIQKARIPQLLLALLMVLLALSLWALVLLLGVGRAFTKPGTVAGLVTAQASGTPLPGATIEAHLDKDAAEVAGSATSGDDGTFSLDLPKGRYRLHFSAPDYDPTNGWYPAATSFDSSKVVVIKRGRKAGAVNMALSGVPASISGMVKAGGHPSGVTVTLRPATGTAQLLSSPPPPLPAATPSSGNSGSLPPTAMPATPGGVLFARPAPTVVPARPAPRRRTHPAASPSATSKTASSCGGLPPATSADEGGEVTVVTDDAGGYTIAGVPAPGSYVVTFKQDGFDPQSIPVEVKPAKDHTVDAELKPATGSICGTVNGTTGPLGGVTIAAAGPGKAETKTVDAGDATTPPGSFWLTGLPTPGAYALTFTADGYEPQTIAITLQPGETKSALTVTLIPTGGGTPVTALAAPPTSDPVPTPTPTPTTGDASAAESHTPKGAEAPAPQPTKTTSPQRPAAPPSGSSHPPPRRNQPDPPPGRGWPLPGQLAR